MSLITDEMMEIAEDAYWRHLKVLDVGETGLRAAIEAILPHLSRAFMRALAGEFQDSPTPGLGGTASGQTQVGR